MKLDANGKMRSTKRTRHYDIKYFFTDLIKKKEVIIKYCPTNAMTADYMTKPLTVHKFKLFRDKILNIKTSEAHLLASRSVLSKIENSTKLMTYVSKSWRVIKLQTA
jgi:hypothetical protein